MTQASALTAPAIFNFGSHSVRIVIRDDQPWFVASDIAEALEYRNAPDMSRFLDDDEAATHNLRIRSENGVEQDREITIISESGLYHAILKSRKPQAKPFRKWITSEVLPTIRKTGRYETWTKKPIGSGLKEAIREAVKEALAEHSALPAPQPAAFASPCMFCFSVFPYKNRKCLCRLWAKEGAVGNASRFPRQALRFAAGELSTTAQTGF